MYINHSRNSSKIIVHAASMWEFHWSNWFLNAFHISSADYRLAQGSVISDAALTSCYHRRLQDNYSAMKAMATSTLVGIATGGERWTSLAPIPGSTDLCWCGRSLRFCRLVREYAWQASSHGTSKMEVVDLDLHGWPVCQSCSGNVLMKCLAARPLNWR
jgi:hypothetical protein